MNFAKRRVERVDYTIRQTLNFILITYKLLNFLTLGISFVKMKLRILN